MPFFFCIINRVNANIKFVIIVVIILFTVIIFPLFMNLNIYYSINVKKLFFSLTLFEVIKLFSGYVEFLKEGICIHLTKYKAIIIENKQLIGVGEKVKPLRDYHIIRVRSLTEIGSKTNNITSFSLAFILNYINQNLEWYFYHSKPYLFLDNRINLYENESVFNVYLKTTVIFNLLMIILSIIKIITEKLIYAISIRKQQN